MDHVNGNGNMTILSPARIAEILDVKETFVNRELRQGKMMGFKVGKSWRVTQESFEEYCSGRINSGNGKRSVSEETKSKIKFHATVRHKEKLPSAVDEMKKEIETIKRTLPGLGSYEKLSMIMKMKTKVQIKAEKEKALETIEEQLHNLAEKAFPGMNNLLAMKPDEIENFFLKKDQAPPKEIAAARAAPGIE